MTQSLDLYRGKVATEGRFTTLSTAELTILLRSRGVFEINSSVAKKTTALFSADGTGKKADKARSYGVPVITEGDLRDAIGAPLAGFRGRLERFIADRPTTIYKTGILAMGDPAPEAVLGRVEDKIGFPLPEAARNLWSQLDGLTLLWMGLSPKWKVKPKPVAWHDACDMDGTFWKRVRGLWRRDSSMGLAVIPPLETIFFTEWQGRMVPDISDLPDVQLGKRTVEADSFYPHLYLFDCFSPYYQAAIWVDRAQQQLHVVYGADYGADWSFAHALPFEIYVESLLAGWAMDRPITLNQKLGATTSMRSVRHLPGTVLYPYGTMMG